MKELLLKKPVYFIIVGCIILAIALIIIFSSSPHELKVIMQKPLTDMNASELTIIIIIGNAIGRWISK